MSLSDKGICRWGYRQFRSLPLMVGKMVARAYLRLHGVQVGAHLAMTSLPYCRRHPGATIRIGDHVGIANRLRENAAGISHRTVLVANRPGARLFIGNHVGLSGVVLFCSKGITIEDHVKLGVGVRVYDTDFHPIDAASRRANDESMTLSAEVRIGSDAWIGAEAMILKGVTIGARAVVGARALVTKDVPPDTVVGGVPARVIHCLGHSEAVCQEVSPCSCLKPLG